MPRRRATFQRELSKLDQLSIVNIDVGLCLGVLGNDALARRYLSLYHARPSHVVRMHVRVNCKQSNTTHNRQFQN